MRALSKKEKVLMVVAALAVSVPLISVLKGEQSINIFADLDENIRQKMDEVRSSRELLAHKDAISAAAERGALLLQKAPSADAEAYFLKELGTMAEAAQVALVDVKPAAPLPRDNYSEYIFDMEVDATMSQLVAFFYKVQQSGGILQVTKFRVSPRTDKQDLLKAYVSISGIVQK